ncbi:alpha-catulin isoform X5 [Emydura macquarii macquarii]|uniref:alpha-catulin isoform X5 n=1 Tax=Emydura macquarii macquarii TaxID=1129001 RepID=UPI00352B6977
MATSPCSSSGVSSSSSSGLGADAGLEIRTRSVEQTLVPLVSQITTLINHKDKPKRSDKTLQAIQRVGQAVNLAVGRFVTVGEAIANENRELKEEMSIACIEAKRAGETIAQLTDVANLDHPESDGRITIFTDKTGVVKAARLLLSSVTKVLVLADRIVIKQIIGSRNKVLATMEQLEKVNSFQEFVQIFSQFGNEMVEFAHLTGDRQNDLKDEKKKARMAAARAVLEKCTMMLLTASKTCLRHPDCESARLNKEGVFHRMRLALEQVIEIVTDSRPRGENEMAPISIYSSITEFKQSQKTKDIIEDLEVAILKTCQCMNELKREFRFTCYFSFKDDFFFSLLKLKLHHAATSLTADLLRYHADHMVLKALKITGAEGNLEAVAEYTCKLSEQKEQLVETCRLLRHVSGTEPLEITCVHAEDTFQVTGPQIISAAETLTLHPSSKIAKENLDVFCEAWESQLSDMSMLLREINDVFEGRRGEKRAYLSLPRPGKHNANLKSLKPVKLDTEEQAKLGKLGLELHLLTSDVDSETEKWEDQENKIVRHGQSISSMAHSIYLFTRGEGLLKTTQDLFHQAEVFSTEGIKLASVLTAFSNQLEVDDKPLLLLEIDKLIPVCQQLQITAKTTVQGKNATFTKVDTCIRKTKDVMTILSQVLPLSYKLLRKCRTGNGCFRSPHPWRENRLQTNTNEDSKEGKTNAFGIKSLDHHVANLTFLESK